MARRGRTENLTPYKKGQSGNRKGRPHKLPGLDELLAKVLGEEKAGMSAAEVILKALRARAARGDTKAAEVLFERAYGKVKQNFEHNLKGKFNENIIGKIEIVETVRHEHSSSAEEGNDSRVEQS